MDRQRDNIIPLLCNSASHCIYSKVILPDKVILIHYFDLSFINQISFHSPCVTSILVSQDLGREILKIV